MEDKILNLSYKWNIRNGGGGKTERKYIDFFINQKYLKDILDLSDIDFIGSLGWSNIDNDKQIIQRYLLKSNCDIKQNNRFLLYICPECGDLGCGAVTFNIEKENDIFVWKNFGFENNYDNKINDLMNLSFYFSKQQYWELLKDLEEELVLYYK